MTIISATDTEPTITHPAWCDSERCHYEPDGGVHWGTLHSLGLHGDGSSDETCEVTLSLSDDDSEPPVWLDVAACDTFTIADLERFALWLVERAAEYRAACAPNDERTVLIEDDGTIVLAVDNDDVDTVYLEGDMPIDRYIFGPKEAREFASALLVHAARVDLYDAAAALAEQEAGR
jgi:hypothetical protein